MDVERLIARLRSQKHIMQADGLAALLETTSEAASALAKLQAEVNFHRDRYEAMRLMQNEAASERDEAREALRPFVLFFDAAIDAWSDGRDFDGSDIQDTAAHLGLLVETTFDPEKHTDETGVGANEGDQWFVLSDAASNAFRAASRALGGGE